LALCVLLYHCSSAAEEVDRRRGSPAPVLLNETRGLERTLGDQGVGVVCAESQQVGITRGAVRLVVPEREEQRALEQEAVGVGRGGDAAEQPLPGEAVQQQVV